MSALAVVLVKLSAFVGLTAFAVVLVATLRAMDAADVRPPEE